MLTDICLWLRLVGAWPPCCSALLVAVRWILHAQHDEATAYARQAGALRAKVRRGR